MMKKPLKKLTSCLITGMMIAVFVSPTTIFAKETRQAEQENTQDNVLKEVKQRVSVHDPSIVKDGNTYYVFGSHIEAAKSSDLKNWTKFTNSYTTPGNAIFDDLSKNLAGSFAWAGENDSDSKGGYAVWAPDVFWNKDYINSNGTKGAYMMYYCTSSTYKRSCIGYAVSQNIEGPYTYADTIVYSGFTSEDAYDSGSTIDTKYTNTNLKRLTDDGTISGTSSNWFTGSGDYNTSYCPNAIDPSLFYDEEGKLWMSYGSWSGGIYMLQIDEQTGKAIYPGKDGTTDGGNITDRYFGTKIAGGYTESGEGSYIVYDKDAGYYYLYMSYAGLAANGGYNMRLFRAKSPRGPYLDAAGNKATLSGAVDNSYCGIKLMGNYKFDCMSTGYKSCGGNSAFIDSDGQRYLVYHTRFNGGTEYHEVRVHQVFINEDGWPVVAPYEYNGDTISKDGYSQDDVVGYYEFINHGTSNSSSMLDTENIKLNSNGTITGDATGTWTMTNGSYYMNVTIDGITYKGVFFKQQDESDYVSKVMTFTAIGSNNQCVWGSKLDVDDDEAVQYAGRVLSNNMPDSTKSNITLPSTGVCDTKISWSSSNPKAISTSGQVKRQQEDTEVTLTATISKGEASFSRNFTVTVKKEMNQISETPIYKYDFQTLKGNKEIFNSGSKEGNAILKGSASIVQDDERGRVLKVTNIKGAIKANYLALPSDTFDGITSDGYTIGMWVNVDTADPNYWQHSALFEANAGGTYPVTRISGNLYSRINSNGAWADATEISNGLTANNWEYVTYTVDSKGIRVYLNGVKVSSASADLSACFTDNFLSKMTNVTVGSGNIWGDADIAAAEFDDVSIYSTALTEDEAEGLYNQEVAAKSADAYSISVDYNISEKWDNSFKASVKLTNTGNQTIRNWALKYNLSGDISEIWDGAILSHIGDAYTVKNSGWPEDISSGETVEFGFIASYRGDAVPDIWDCSITSAVKNVESSDYNSSFSKTSEWDGGFNGKIKIANIGRTAIEDWVMEFDYKDSIDSMWGAEIVSHEGNHYVIKGSSYDANIKVGGSISIGFSGTPASGDKSTEVPQSYVLTEVTNS